MVFSSLPAYLDPSNWQQQPNHNHFHQAPGANQQLIITPPPHIAPPPSSTQPPHAGGVGSPGSIRPGSMAERARQANIPMPEGPLNCPRCDSTNTKFCYFNNYNLTQPRHFCKSCRRYWTRGGALRNVPVGGGCRRNKRSKSTSNNSNKSPISSDRQPTSSSTSTISSHNTGLLQSTHANSILSGVGLNSPLPPLRFMSPLGQFTDNYNSASDIGLNFSGISTQLVGGTSEMNFPIGRNLIGSGAGGGIEQWRIQQQAHQFPFLSGLEAQQSAAGIYPFQLGGSGEGVDPPSRFGGEASHHHPHYLQLRPNKLSASFLSQLGSVKMEDCNNNNQAAPVAGSLVLSRQFLGMNNATTADQTETDDHQWSNNNTINNNNNSAWTDLSSFSSSSTSNPM